ADGLHFVGVLIQRNDGGLIDHDALAARIHQRVGRPEIDGEVARKHAEQRTQIVRTRRPVMKPVVRHSNTSLSREFDLASGTRAFIGSRNESRSAGIFLLYVFFYSTSMFSGTGCHLGTRLFRTAFRTSFLY